MSKQPLFQASFATLFTKVYENGNKKYNRKVKLKNKVGKY